MHTIREAIGIVSPNTNEMRSIHYTHLILLIIVLTPRLTYTNFTSISARHLKFWVHVGLVVESREKFENPTFGCPCIGKKILNAIL